MFINVVIPCCSLHIKWIKPCLLNLSEQTRKPNNVILVLNEYSRYKNEYDEIINDYPEYIFVKIETFERPGINRNIGSKYATEGIIIYHDVDDLMHKQKCEIVEYLFETYKCGLLLHYSYKSYQEIPHEFNVDNLKIIEQNKVTTELNEKTNIFKDENCIIHFNHYFGYINNKNGHSAVCHGHCNVLCNLVKENETFWTDFHESEDVIFNNRITKKYKNTLILLEPLTITVGEEHIRKIDNDIYHKKSKKLLNYKLQV